MIGDDNMLRRFTCVVLFVCLLMGGCSGKTPQSTPEPADVIEPMPSPTSENGIHSTPPTESDRPKQLLASISEMDVCAYAYARNIKDETGLTYHDIYLEVNNKEPLWLYARPLARSEFRLYYGKFFDDGRDYLIFVDYEHGGHGGGTEFFIVIDFNNHSVIPLREVDMTSYYYQLNDSNIVFTPFDSWQFEIPIDKLVHSYKIGNIVIIENNRLVTYTYYTPGIPHDIQSIDGQLTLCFRAEYALKHGEVYIVTVDFVEDGKFYTDDWD
jgi:hypothetical protein